jgi:hypothetical protein
MQLDNRALLFASILLMLTVIPARAEEDRTCTARINGDEIEVDYSLYYDDYIENTTFREIFLANWDGGCPSYVVLATLTPELTASERAAFCLEHDDEAGYYTSFAPGERDAYGKCKTDGKFCQTVNATKEEALAIVGLGTGAVGGTALATSAAGVTAVAHSSGAVILTGTSGYIAGTLGTAAASVVSVLTAPAVIAGTVVSVVAVGGAVYVCNDTEQP